MRQSMVDAMKEGDVDPKDVGYVKAHATGTLKGDLAEAAAIRKVMGSAVDGIPVSSLKPVIGHAVGTSAALETVLVLKALAEGLLPPTANLEEPDEKLGLNLIQGAPRESRTRVALLNSAGFGGTNATLVLRAFASPKPEGGGG